MSAANWLATSVLLVSCLAAASSETTQKPRAMNTDMLRVKIWYDAFNRKDASLLEEILDSAWIDVPSAPGQPAGPSGAKHALDGLTAAFPDLKVSIEAVLRDGDKVIVRSHITGTQAGTFMGIAPTHRQLSIQAVDIHQFKDGRIIRTWHTEDWLTGLRQLGALDR
jgi:predicted ester cyclase